jgi:phosphate-selective porin OprO/OprP
VGISTDPSARAASASVSSSDRQRSAQRIARAIAACLAAAFFAAPAGAVQGPAKNPWIPTFDLSEEGVRIEWDDWAKLRFGGLFQGDWGWIERDAFVDPGGWDGEVRRARIDMEGEIAKYFVYRFEVDVSGHPARVNDPDRYYQDIWIGVQGIPWLGTLRVGNMKEPYSLQHLTDAGHRVFMEESMLTAFTPGRNFGIQLNHHLFDQRMTWAFGGFQEVTDDSSFFGRKGDWDLGLRLTGLLWYRDEGRQLVHFGTSYIHAFGNGGRDRTYIAKPENNLANPLPRTELTHRGEDLLGGELAFVFGPVHFQLETSVIWQKRSVGAKNTHTKSAYAQLGVFLTGENRPYDTAKGVFGRVAPKNPVTFPFRDGGWGAWELAVRGSYLDSNTNTGADDPRAKPYGEIGVALNWYARKSIRLDTNYLYHFSRGGSNMVVMRAQFLF